MTFGEILGVASFDAAVGSVDPTVVGDGVALGNFYLVAPDNKLTCCPWQRLP